MLKRTLCVLSMAALLGCDSIINENDPTSVAQSFWLSALSEKKSEAKKFMKNSEVPIGIKGFSDDDSFRLGQSYQQNGFYFIDTFIQLKRAGGVYEIPLRTVIVPDSNGKWKVDYFSTKTSILEASLDNSFRLFNSTISGVSKYMDNPFMDSKDSVLEKQLTEEFELTKKKIITSYLKASESDE